MNSDDQNEAKNQRRRRYVSVYDAVAGRVGYEGFLREQRPSKHRDTTSTSAVAVPPDEVLFRSKGAPVRYEENDIYFADRHLASDQQLPESDLLKAIHAYASAFYFKHADAVDENKFRSLDETALLAMGILMDEAAKKAAHEQLGLAATADVPETPGSSKRGKSGVENKDTSVRVSSRKRARIPS